MKAGQRWWVPKWACVVEVHSVWEHWGAQYVRLKNEVLEVPIEAVVSEGWQLLAPNQVYEYGGELFVTLDATPRMRNLRTGLTIRPRVTFNYLGEMPRVGQVWRGADGYTFRITDVFKDGTTVADYTPRNKGTYSRLICKRTRLLLENTLQTEPTYHFATGDKDAIKAGAQDVEAAQKLYMAPDGETVQVHGSTNARVGITRKYKKSPEFISADTFKALYKALPLPGQVWSKGKRYVAVQMVRDERVHYTGGSSGLRRFLNEYRGPIDTALEPKRPWFLNPTVAPESTRNGDKLGYWAQYRRILGAKIHYANQRIKELSK